MDEFKEALAVCEEELFKPGVPNWDRLFGAVPFFTMFNNYLMVCVCVCVWWGGVCGMY